MIATAFTQYIFLYDQRGNAEGAARKGVGSILSPKSYTIAENDKKPGWLAGGHQEAESAIRRELSMVQARRQAWGRYIASQTNVVGVAVGEV